MQLFLPEDNKGIVYLYYVVDDKELEYIVNHQYKLFPIRFFTQKYFCPFLNHNYAQRVASESSNWRSEITVVHMLRFLMRTSNLKRYVKGSVDNPNALIVVLREELQQFNKHIIGYIERIETYNLHEPANQLAFV